MNCFICPSVSGGQFQFLVGSLIHFPIGRVEPVIFKLSPGEFFRNTVVWPAPLEILTQLVCRHPGDSDYVAGSSSGFLHLGTADFGD